MTDRIAIDTNLIIYALDPAEPAKRAVVADLLSDAACGGRLRLSRQCLNECYRVLAHKRRFIPIPDARAFITTLEPFCLHAMDRQTTEIAWAVEEETRFSWWNCMMVAAALQAGCGVLLSEDMQDGRRIDMLTIRNPFAFHSGPPAPS